MGVLFGKFFGREQPIPNESIAREKICEDIKERILDLSGMPNSWQIFLALQEYLAKYDPELKLDSSKHLVELFGTIRPEYRPQAENLIRLL
jgi:hypothetical protein